MTYENVYAVNMDTSEAVCYRMGKVMIDRYGQKFAVSSYELSLRLYVEREVLAEDKHLFDRILMIKEVKALLSDRQTYSFIYRVARNDAIEYFECQLVKPKSDRNEFAVGFKNVSDEKKQELALQAACDAAEAANKAKTEFLSNMSHDIRTPMNGIIGMTAIAATHIDDKERVQDCLQKISQASKHMLSLINEVLDMSKIESGKVDLNEEEFNLSNLVDNLLTMTSAQINKHHHELSVKISGVTHEEVIGDSLRIQKVFTNLMSNTVKYTPDGGRIRFSITEKPSFQETVGCYEFIFEDNGIGMSEEFMEKIFEPFSRAIDERVNKIQGIVLGMPISRNIVRMMGGDIKVESKLNVGMNEHIAKPLDLKVLAKTLNKWLQ